MTKKIPLVSKIIRTFMCLPGTMLSTNQIFCCVLGLSEIQLLYKFDLKHICN